MKNDIEFIGIVLKINGKKKTINKNKCRFEGWAWTDEECGCSDNGVDLIIDDGKKRYKISLE
jgi:hypothetical protein